MAVSPFTTNIYGPSSSNPTGSEGSIPVGTFSMSESSIGLMAGNPSFESKIKKSPPEPSGERLEFARPRSTNADQSSRGTNAYIALMTSDEQASQYASKSSPRSQGSDTSPESSALADTLAVMTAGSGSSGYDKFLLTGVQASMDEKVQVMEVFGDNEVAYYFGRAPMMFNISGMLIDSPDNSWFTDWLEVYAGALRGSQLAKNFELLKLVLPNMTLIGSMVNFGWEQNSQNDVAIPFRFQFLVKNLIPTPVVPVGQGLTNAANMINFDAEQTFTTWSQINDLRQQGAMISNVIQNPLSTLSDYSSAMRNYGSGVAASLGVGSARTAVSDFIDGITSKISGGTGSISGIFRSLASSLEGIRASIFSPIYGVMNSLTRLVRTIVGGAGISSIFNTLTAPIRNILGDITRIASQASAIVGLITAGTTGLGRGITSGFGAVQSYQSAINAIGKAAGCITSAPTTVSDNLRNMFNGGNISSSAKFLRSNPKYSLSRSASLPPLPGSAPSGSASLSARAGLSSQIAILGGGTKRVSTPGASL